MNAKRIKEMIAQGEGINLEFKSAKNDLPRSIYETVCAFLNREGGHILLGVEDDGKISGVNPKSIPQMLDILTKNINNLDILDPTFYLGSAIIEVDGKSVVDIYVPASSQAHRHKGQVYDRGGDGDFKIKNNKMISALYVRKQESYTENRVFPYLELEDFDSEMLRLARKLLTLNRADHPWASMTDEEMLMAAHMRLKDQQTGQVGYTLAAALLFGKEHTLASVLPHYKTDALCRKYDTVLYDDRDDIRCNLMQAYYRLLDFVHKHLPERSIIDGVQRISLREVIFRELVANLLVHREYSNAYPATLSIYANRVETKNWNRPYVSGHISLENLSPHPKNPTLAHFFKQLGWVEELGSGVMKLYRYVPIYAAGEFPSIQEGDLFCTNIPYVELEGDENTDGGEYAHEEGGCINPQEGGGINIEKGEFIPQGGCINGEKGEFIPQGGCINGEKGEFIPQGGCINPQEGGGINMRANGNGQQYIFSLIVAQTGRNTRQIAEASGKSQKSVLKHIQALRKKGMVEFRGARKTGGYYPISKP